MRKNRTHCSTTLPKKRITIKDKDPVSKLYLTINEGLTGSSDTNLGSFFALSVRFGY